MKKRTVIRLAASILATSMVLSGCMDVHESSDSSSDETATTASADDSAESASSMEDKKSKKDKEDDASKAASETTLEDKSNASKKTDEQTLVNKLVQDKKLDPADVKETLYKDFDGDEAYEAFIYVGEDEDEYAEYFGSVYYVTESKCEELVKDMTLRTGKNDKIFDEIDLPNKTLVIFHQSYTTDTLSHVYYVSKSKCKEADISKTGYIFQREGSDDICLSIGMYDGNFEYKKDDEKDSTWVGHTWKTYYLYYDERTDEFKEYGGYEITAEEVTQICGFDLVKEITDAGFSVDSIYERGNGILNINYSETTTTDDGYVNIFYHNASYDQKQKRFLNAGFSEGDGTWQASDFFGTYVPALLEEIATYDKYDRG